MPPIINILKDCGLTKRVDHLKKAYFRAMPEICIERPRYVTDFTRKQGLFGKEGLLDKERISILDKARTYRHVLENRDPIVHFSKAYERGNGGAPQSFDIADNSLFAGSTTSKFKGVPLYPELIGLAIWPELWTVSKRTDNPFHITDEEVETLNYEIFPHWIKSGILELGRQDCPDEVALFQRLVFFITSKPECISHTIPDFSRAIGIGLRGIIDDARERELSTPDPEQKEFYRAIPEALEGIIAYSRKLADKAEEMASQEENEALKRELLKIAEINRRVPEFPARTFREGLTAVWICWIAIHLENANAGLSLGRLDQVLYDLYRNDIEKKTISVEDAVELVCCLWLKIGDHVPCMPNSGEQLFGGAGSNQAITIGGVDKDGNDAVNDLSYVMLKATELMRLRDPNLNARFYMGKNPEEYLREICRVNITTGATPAIHNDKAVIASLKSKGETDQQARDYGVIGCVEPASNGRSYGHSGAILLNLTSALEFALFNGRHRHTGDELISMETGDPSTFDSFDKFKAAFRKQADWLADQAINLNNGFGKAHQRFYPTPILSALFEGPMESGKDLVQGGATLNSSGAAIIGLADVADSLSAINKIVYEDKMPFDEFLDIIKNNFQGHDDLRDRIMDPDITPRYGNDDDAADDMVTWLMTLLDDKFTNSENYRGGKYRVGYWTMTSHAGFGRLMKASPNGRKDRENFTSGITPVSGVTPNLLKALSSVAKQPPGCLSNGVALNLKYIPEYTKDENGDIVNMDEMLDDFIRYVKAYIDYDGGTGDGGMEIQFNVTDHDTFAEAVKHPEKYPELLVRVSGYTAYFKDLNPQMQKEIIDRTEYRLSSGKMIPYDPFPLRERRE